MFSHSLALSSHLSCGGGEERGFGSDMGDHESFDRPFHLPNSSDLSKGIVPLHQQLKPDQLVMWLVKLALKLSFDLPKTVSSNEFIIEARRV